MANKDTKKNGFPERLKNLRMAKGLSQTDIAKRIGVNPNNIGRYERGESNPNSKFLKALSECLDVSTDYLYDGIEEDAAVADLKDKEFLEMFVKAEQLPDKEKKVIKELLSAFIKNKEMEKLIAS